jgi:hypothetical protein
MTNSSLELSNTNFSAQANEDNEFLQPYGTRLYRYTMEPNKNAA